MDPGTLAVPAGAVIASAALLALLNRRRAWAASIRARRSPRPRK
jgi:hypothetical protein